METTVKLPEHVRVHHKDATLVIELLILDNMPSNENKIRKKAILDKIRKRGIYHNNQLVMQQGGVFQVEQYPKKRMTYIAFLPCHHCLGYYHKDTLFKHLKTCFWGNKEKSKRRTLVQAKAQMFHNVEYHQPWKRF